MPGYGQNRGKTRREVQFSLGEALGHIVRGCKDGDNSRAAEAMVDIVRYAEGLERRICSLENRNRLRDWPL